MVKFVLALATLLATAYAVDAGHAVVDGLRNKLAIRFAPIGFGAHGNGASATSSVGGSGRDLYASSAASAGSHYGRPQHYAGHDQPQLPLQQHHYPAPAYAYPAAPAHFLEEEEEEDEAPLHYQEPQVHYAHHVVNPYEQVAQYQEHHAPHHHHPVHRVHHGRPHAHQQHGGAPSVTSSAAAAAGHGGSASAAASAHSPVYAYPPAPVPAPAPVAHHHEQAQPAPPPKPSINLDSIKSRKGAPRFARGGSASASSAAGNGAVASAAAVAASNGGYSHNELGPNSYSASAGTYANDGNGRESRSYQKTTSSEDVVENGHADDNHYFKSGSFGKSADENLYEAYNKDDDDVEQTDNTYKRKKRGENYVLSYNKAESESGSHVLSKDRHSSHFAKTTKKLDEKVDEKYNKEGNGIVVSENYSNSKQIDDEDEEAFDSDGFNKAPASPVPAPAKAAPIQRQAPVQIQVQSPSASSSAPSVSSSSHGSTSATSVRH